MQVISRGMVWESFVKFVLVTVERLHLIANEVALCQLSLWYKFAIFKLGQDDHLQSYMGQFRDDCLRPLINI